MKNIESYLTKVMDIDVSMVKKEPGKRMTTKPTRTAYEQAMNTANNSSDAKAAAVSTNAAKASRRQLKAILVKRPELNKEERPTERRGGGKLDVGDLASMQAELTA